jgi:hypothetical protein
MPSKNSIIDRFTLFGVRVAVKCDDLPIMNMVRALLSVWDATEFHDGTASVYIVLCSYNVNSGIPANGPDTAGTSGGGGSSLEIRHNGIVAFADGARGYGTCIYPDGRKPGDEFRELFNTLVLFLVAQAGRIPLHASAVIHNETAVVFAGRSGSGKSSLALAANRAGLPILSDDTVYIQSARCLRIWGLPKAIHVIASDAPASGLPGMRYRSGRWKRVLPIATGAHVAERAILCVLARGQEVSLLPMRIGDAVAATTHDPEPGYGFYGSRSPAAVRAIAAGGCWKLTLSRDADAAIAAILSGWPRICRSHARLR